MIGQNRRVSLISIQRPTTDGGSVVELEKVEVSNIRATIQANILAHLPPPADKPLPSGHFYLREFRCWIAKRSIPNITPMTHWIVQIDSTKERFRIHGVLDDAGRSHHWLFRMENYRG